MPSLHFARPFSRPWRRQGGSGLRLLVPFSGCRDYNQIRTQEIILGYRKGEHGSLEIKRGFIYPSSIPKCMTEDKRLIWICSPRQPWLAVVGSLYLQPPATLVCRGRDAGPFSFFQIAQQKCSCALRTKEDRKEQRDAHSTSKLGVSRR